MTRLEDAFKNRPAFMPYFPLGYPDLETSIEVLDALGKNGADLMEVGLSFSDPLADGPVIQNATQVALENGITVRKSLAAVRELRKRGVDVPLVLMGYFNPMLAYGLEAFVSEAAAAGADGFIVPDLPPEESGEFQDVSEKTGLPLIRMMAPTTPPDRMEALARDARGFIYLVSVTGITGERGSTPESLPQLIARVRRVASVPVCVGFGISSPAQARDVGALADGVIVGSACVRVVGASQQPAEAAAEFARGFQRALAEV